MLTEEQKKRISIAFDVEVERELDDDICISFARLVKPTDDYPPSAVERAKQKVFERLTSNIEKFDFDFDILQTGDLVTEEESKAIISYLTQLNK